MSALGERTLILHLVSKESLEIMAREGVPEEIIPSEELRPIVAWAIDYFFRCGRDRAPSIDALLGVEHGKETFGSVLEDHEIDMGDEPEDSVEWALDDLRGSYVHMVAQEFNRDFATQMSNADIGDRVGVLSEWSDNFIELSLRMERRDRHVDVREGVAQTIIDYEGRAASGTSFRGMTLGIPMVDEHTHGIRDGELAFFAAGPKVGKSYMLAWVTVAEWRAGRSPAIFTLENSVEMTMDRIVCIAACVDSASWQAGKCSADEIERVHAWATEIEKSSNPIWVLRPDVGQSSVQSIVREAQVREADSLLIDQLSHIELPDGRKPKTERIGTALQMLKNMISDGRDALACLLAHQINREGVKAARKLGYLEMEHLAESAHCERTGDWIFSGYAAPDDLVSGIIKMQTLAARRAPLNNWELKFQLAQFGKLEAIREYQI